MGMLVLECLGVGLYCACLSLLVKHPFLFGVVKHGSGYVLGIHDAFCRLRQKGMRAPMSYAILSVECVQEGLAVWGLSAALGTSAVAYFFIGVLLHAAAEYFWVHRGFLKRCV